jgi:hypothetical protein
MNSTFNIPTLEHTRNFLTNALQRKFSRSVFFRSLMTTFYITFLVEKPTVPPTENQHPQVGSRSWFWRVLGSTWGWLLGSPGCVHIIMAGGTILFLTGYVLARGDNAPVGFVIMAVVFLAVSAGVGALAGAVIGGAKWPVPRRKGPRTRGWVKASSLGLAVGRAVGLWAVGWQVPGGGWRWLGGLEHLLALVVFGLVTACISGSALVWLLRQPVMDADPW